MRNFLFVIIMIFSGCAASPSGDKADSIISVTSIDSVTVLDSIKKQHELENRFYSTKTPIKINGFQYIFEKDSMLNDHYLEIFGRDTDRIAFYGTLFIRGNDRHVNTGNYTEWSDAVGDYEIHSDTLIYYGYDLATKVYDDNTTSSREWVVKKKLLFGRKGTLVEIENRIGLMREPLFGEVSSRLKKQIASINRDH